MSGRVVQLAEDWKQALGDEFDQPYMQQLRAFLLEEKAAGKVIFPPGPLIFNALNSTPLSKVKVVIIGQDPYHGPGQAHGLCFSVQPGVRPPPSLQNIYKEIHRDLGYPIPSHGCLQSWAEQGVLLLNAVLTVTQGQAGAHANRGWERFTSRIIEILNSECEHLVFMLWGSYAQKKGQHIDTSRHCVLKSVHPSPLSAHRGFIGCGHFSAANAYLMENGREPINWQLS
ncbi:uracil-DNA glycosylase [Halopseudomonas pertucinogena]|uniref:Uracil-DNA glycosylase n=1 Tax=Halopseudomonas pertucinogena TaxID=86175 RepID=A0ABQ2CHJ2_9GAMM|nr:uracil-DNA glycosylase [Halopseudomonas pertucinogena]